MFIEKIKQNGLFVKMFLVMCLSIIFVSVALTFAMLNMSEKQFINTFSMSNSKLMEQITSNFEKYGRTSVSIIRNAEESEVVKDFLTNTDPEALTTVNHLYAMREWVNTYYDFLLTYEGINIVFMGENEQFYSSNYVNWPITEALLRNHPITEKTYADAPRVHINYFQGIEMTARDIEPTVVISKALTGNDGETFGIIFISIREADFKAMYTKYTGVNSEMMLVDQSGKIISGNEMALSKEEQKTLFDSAKDLGNADYAQIKLNRQAHLLFSQQLPYLDLYAVNVINLKDLKNSLVNPKIIIAIGGGIVLFALVIVLFISNRFTKSHSTLIKEITRMGNRNFNHYVSDSKNYEVNQIATAFNTMLDELHHYVAQVMVMEKKKRVAELEALQYQINPHFLYNTLASIKILVAQQDTKKSTEMIHALIHLLQTTIGSLHEMHSVEEEVNYLKNYGLINEMRYGEKIQVRYLVQPESLSCEMPKLFIQPFVENAFFHGFTTKPTGHIQILIYLKDEQLICEVVDNGDGMQIDPTEKRHHFSGIGIENVRERIRLLYGEGYGVQIESKIGKGTKIRITLPSVKLNKE